MNAEHMTPAEEFEFYGRPKNLRPQGPAQRRSPRLPDSVAERDPIERGTGRRSGKKAKSRPN